VHAIRQYDSGPAENLRYEKAGDPEPGPGQVPAAGVHLVDTAIRAGIPAAPSRPAGPAPGPERCQGSGRGRRDGDRRGAGSRVSTLDAQVRERGLRPGGSAPLLAAALFVDGLGATGMDGMAGMTGMAVAGSRLSRV
jgi:NADPH2:quinone reductase